VPAYTTDWAMETPTASLGLCGSAVTYWGGDLEVGDPNPFLQSSNPFPF